MIDDILVKNRKGIITQKDIEISIDEYQSTLRNPEELYSQKSMVFNGLLRHIYKTNIKPILPDKQQNDYLLLDNIFIYIYLPLCYSFNRLPSISTYCNHLVNISYSNIYNIKNGVFVNGYKVNKDIQVIIKKWDEYCTTDLVDNIIHTNSIGCIFRAKTIGFSEQQNINIQVTPQNVPALDVNQLEQIAQSDEITPPPMITDNAPGDAEQVEIHDDF